ncbi:MATE family efflux transporter [Beduini massiliensis]|uniref:MATE family efflux transporter n=1 Tax=Beduini massiliensis TaxID=1585974 RepID=UPI0009E2B3FD|nr:MATE family efflux transporter [Beduini massiliensis]
MNTLKLSMLSSIDLAKGKPLKVIIFFALPLIIANLFQTLYTTVDTIIVGKYVSTLALASVGATTPVIDLLLGLAIGLSSGLSIVIAQKVGANDSRATKRAIVNGFYLIAFTGISVMIAGLLLNHSLFKIINVSDELMSGALTYSTIIFIGSIFASIYNYESAILRAHGNSVVPLLFLILSALLNIILDLIFVIVCQMGIAGVALATVFSELICCILCFIYMKKKLDILVFEKDDYAIRLDYIKEQIKIGLPMAFFQSLLAISFLVVQSALNTLGSYEVAAYTAAYKMDSLMMQTLSGFGTAISTFSAQNYGNNSFDRIRQGAKSMLKITVILSLIVMVFAQLFSRQFMTLFVNESEVDVIRLGVQYISFTSCCYFILGVNFIVRFVLTGIGQSSIPLGVGVLEVIVRCLGTYFLVYPLGFTGMIYINPLCWGTSTLLIVCVYPILLNKTFKKKMKKAQ